MEIGDFLLLVLPSIFPERDPAVPLPTSSPSLPFSHADTGPSLGPFQEPQWMTFHQSAS